MYRTVAFLVFDRQDVQDIVNEVYIQMWKSLHTYDRNRSYRFWLHGLIVRQVQDWKRKVWRRLRLLDRKKSMEVEEFAETDRTVLQGETRQELMDALQQLS
jgi:RNA polymerase sigma-70 factor, ECF subfamily